MTQMHAPVVSRSYAPLDPVCYDRVPPAPNTPQYPVGSVVVGNNADLMEQVASLWIANNDVVVDATYGKGVFWRRSDQMADFTLRVYDRLTGHDLRSLPEEDDSVDVLVLDPPYRPTHGSKGFAGRDGMMTNYQLGLDDLHTINDVLALYRGGVQEAWRVLRPGGRIMVKCMDLSISSRLHLATLDVLEIIRDQGFKLADQFILVPKAGKLPSPQWKGQERARRSHSVLWVGVHP